MVKLKEVEHFFFKNSDFARVDGSGGNFFETKAEGKHKR